MSQKSKDIVHELEEIADIPETIIDISEEDIVIDLPEEEKPSGEFEEITDLTDSTSSTITIEDENPSLQLHEMDDDVINITLNVDAINEVRVNNKSSKPAVIKPVQKAKLFEDIPEPMESFINGMPSLNVKEEYVHTAYDDENREVKGKIYFDNAADALVIEDIVEEDEKLSQKSESQKLSQKTIEQNKNIPTDVEQHASSAMSDDKESQKGNSLRSDVITIEIPPEVRTKIEKSKIEDFDFINLDEAEQIASEEILILSEDDLIEELEEYDLIPVDTSNAVNNITAKEKSKNDNINSEDYVRKEVQGKDDTLEVSIMGDVKKQKVEHDASQTSGIIHEKAGKISKNETTIIKEGNTSAIIVDHETRGKVHIQSTNNVTKNDKTVESIIEDVSEILIDDDKAMGSDATISTIKPVAIETKHAEESFKVEPIIASLSGDSVKEVTAEQPAKPFETIPDDIQKMLGGNQRIVIVDDAGVGGTELPVADKSIDEIDNLVSGMIEITEGEAKILTEAGFKEEEEYIAPILTGTIPTFQDKMVEFGEEYKFSDDDIVFVDNAIVTDEYDKYLKVIDEYYETKTVKKGSSTSELFGLSNEELAFFYDVMFEKEYETVKASKTFKDVAVGRDQPQRDETLIRQFKYIESKPKSFSEKEKRSIEENIESPMAVIIEENIDDIVERLKTIKPQIDINNLLSTAPDKEVNGMLENVSESFEKSEGINVEQQKYTNITDQVIVLESKDDVNRFVDTLPVEKRESIRKLLKYLDSLFDKLPEEVIKNFANSEYFDLYVKVLNELGV
ncbi:MAG TPA: hypothetical protein PLJ75_00335 [Spirochaetota bacterium]|nr:hypothetical protein [Spirochaetota bacterium]